MRKMWRKLALPAVGALMGGTGLAYLSGGFASNSYASTSESNVGAYATYDISYVPDGTTGLIGYVHFNAIPTDNSHTVQSDAGDALVQFNGTGSWVSCTRNTINRSYTDSYSSGSVTDNGSPESNWTCDVRGNAPATVDVHTLNIQVLH